jgi:hypothetical protein
VGYGPNAGEVTRAFGLFCYDFRMDRARERRLRDEYLLTLYRKQKAVNFGGHKVTKTYAENSELNTTVKQPKSASTSMARAG